jgi:hypothetical protein
MSTLSGASSLQNTRLSRVDARASPSSASANPGIEPLQPSLVTHSGLVPQTGDPVSPEPHMEDEPKSPDMAPQSSPSIFFVPQDELSSAVLLNRAQSTPHSGSGRPGSGIYRARYR